MFAEPKWGRIPVPASDEDAARRGAAQGHPAVRPARRASAVVLVRDGREGPEVLLRHRAGQGPLGVVGLPGGSLTGADGDLCPWYGPTPRDWARTWGESDLRRARERVVGAVRELYEEAGLLLAGAREHELVPDPASPLWAEDRASMEDETVGLPAVLQRRGLGLRTDLLRPVGRWISPDHRHRRFDAAVFAAAAPAEQTPRPRPVATDPRAEQGQIAWVSVVRLREGTAALPGPEGWAGAAGGVPVHELAAPVTLMVVDQIAAAGSATAFLLSLDSAAQGRRAPTWRVVVEESDGRAWMRPVADPGL